MAGAERRVRDLFRTVATVRLGGWSREVCDPGLRGARRGVLDVGAGCGVVVGQARLWGWRRRRWRAGELRRRAGLP
eukprot:7017460-Alexandrium_andersonii.AAC.1